MNAAAAAGGGLTHDEIWDDTALIESWNEALDEYKKYHSIHAEGGTVDDVLDSSPSQAVPAAPEQSQWSAEAETRHGSGGGERENDETTMATARLGPGTVEDASNGEPSKGTTGGDSHSHPPNVPLGPQAVLGSIQDGGLKKLLMSWYYAGYYTGLYEGQQQQTASTTK